MDAHCVGKSVFWGKTVDDIKVSAAKRASSLPRRGSSPTMRVPEKKRFYLSERGHLSSSDLEKLAKAHQSLKVKYEGLSPAFSDGGRDIRSHLVASTYTTAASLDNLASGLSPRPVALHTSTPNSAMKKSLTVDNKSAHRLKKRGGSPLVPRKSNEQNLTGSSTSTSGSTSRLRALQTEGAALSTSPASDGHSDSEAGEFYLGGMTMPSTNGGSSSDAGADDVDGHAIDPVRTQQAIEHLQQKIHKTMELIKAEQNAKEENVNEYLRLSSNADKQQQARIKQLFEKKNQKSTQTVAQLQRKLENYQKRLKDVETFGVSGHKQAKEVLRDVGQGLKKYFSKGSRDEPSSPSYRDVGANIRDGITGFSGGVVDNIRGAKDTIVSKPKEFAHLIKNRFGSADNINDIKAEEVRELREEGDRANSHPGSGTLPASFKYPSEDDQSSIISGSDPSGVHSSPQPQSGTLLNPVHPSHLPETPKLNLDPILNELRDQREVQQQLRESIESMKTVMANDYGVFKQAIEEERFRCERLEEQINDLTELHQHEVTNIKQELSSMEEKMEYQLEERTRDMQELLETCQTRITKMELQQQQQQLISMEGIENSNFRALLTKLINVMLSLLAVILIFVSTVASLLGPFLTTRLRILTTVVMIAAIVAAWQNWPVCQELSQRLIERYRRHFPVK